jgi:hypothetical protein
MTRIMAKPQFCIPMCFHTSASDVLPKNEFEEEHWRKYAVPAKSRWV